MPTYAELSPPEKIIDVTQWAASRIAEINKRLFEIEDLFKRLQPKKSGAVLLDLQYCQRLCLGCPHTRWVQWKWHEKNESKNWVGHVVPKARYSQYFKSTDDFADTYQTRVMLGQEVTALVAERSKIIKHLSSLSMLRAAIAKHSNFHPELNK